MDDRKMLKLENYVDALSNGVHTLNGKVSVLEVKQTHQEKTQDEISECVKILTKNQIELSQQIHNSVIAANNTNKILGWILKSLLGLGAYLLSEVGKVMFKF